MKAISLEFFKLRRKGIFLIMTIFLLIEIAWLYIVISMSISRNPEYAKWELIIVTLSSMNGLFLPILSAICVSRISDMEHKGNTWKLLLSLSINPMDLYRAKYFIGSFIMLWICVLQVVSIIVIGTINGFNDPVPLFLLFQFFIGTALTNMVIIALQQWISLAVKNQAFALCMGMVGGFIGMTADLFSEKVGRIFVWSYYTKLSPIAQSYTTGKINFIVRNMSSLLPMMAILIVVTICIYITGSIYISRREI